MSDKPKYYRSTFMFQGHRYERKSQKSQRDADRKADALKLQLERGEIGISSNMTVKAWAKEWLEVYKKPIIGESQYQRYNGIIKNIIIPAIGSRPLNTIKDIELQKIVNNRAGKSKSDLKKLRDTLRSIFRRAHAAGLIPKNPTEYLELPPAKEGTHRNITKYEREKILSLAETHPAGLWVKLMLYCGLRPGETRALDWRHVDLNKKLIHVEVAMKARTHSIGAPKSDAGIRDVPIPDTLMPALKAAAGAPFEPVIVKPLSKKRHTERSMFSMWQNFKRELDISMGAKLYRNKIMISVVAPDLVPYCLRHTYCSDLQDAGVPINVARYLMGHSDIRVTAAIYTHTTDKTIEDARTKINTAQNSYVDDTVAQMPQALENS